MNVLIVDDDMATVDVICKSVNWSALHIDKVMTAYNIEKAKEVLADIPADIVVCDIEMPMGNGTELLKWVRENDMSSEFLFLTCHTEFQYASVAIRYQAAGYLVKPFRVEQVEAELLRLVQRIMEKRKIEEESHYGKWMRNNQEQLMNNFWRALTERELRAEPEFIDREIKKTPSSCFGRSAGMPDRSKSCQRGTGQRSTGREPVGIYSGKNGFRDCR